MKNIRPTAAKDPDWEEPYVPKESYENCLLRLPDTLLRPALVVLSSRSFPSQFPRVHRMIPILHHLRPNRQTGRLDLLDIVLRPDR
jgi:hypothetical protein